MILNSPLIQIMHDFSSVRLLRRIDLALNCLPQSSHPVSPPCIGRASITETAFVLVR